jgi:hypothetical protein
MNLDLNSFNTGCRHGIEKPKEKDLMLNVDTNRIPDIFYMWPPRKSEEDDE